MEETISRVMILVTPLHRGSVPRRQPTPTPTYKLSWRDALVPDDTEIRRTGNPTLALCLQQTLLMCSDTFHTIPIGYVGANNSTQFPALRSRFAHPVGYTGITELSDPVLCTFAVHCSFTLSSLCLY